MGQKGSFGWIGCLVVCVDGSGLFVCFFVCLFAYLFVCSFVCLFVCSFVSLDVCLAGWVVWLRREGSLVLVLWFCFCASGFVV